MKFKAVRSSLAAVLTATLLISLLPLAYAGSPRGQTQQDASSSKPRRGKNGEPVAKSPDNPDTAPAPDSTQDSNTEPSKPDTSKTVAPARPTQAGPSASPDRTSRSAEQTMETSSQREPAPSGNSSARQDPPATERSSARQLPAESQAQTDAPPFDRPPLRANGRPAGDVTAFTAAVETAPELLRRRAVIAK